MTALLQINSSVFSSDGHSSQLANEFVAAWHANNQDALVTVRDLANEPIPHLDAQRVSAFFTPPEARTVEQKVFIEESNALIDELKQSDVIVIGLPMYNFGIPSTLKAYFDQIARAGVTFRYRKRPRGFDLRKKNLHICNQRRHVCGNNSG